MLTFGRICGILIGSSRFPYRAAARWDFMEVNYTAAAEKYAKKEKGG